MQDLANRLFSFSRTVMSGYLLEIIANLTTAIHLMLLDVLRPQSFIALLVFLRQSTFFLLYSASSAHS